PSSCNALAIERRRSVSRSPRTIRGRFPMPTYPRPCPGEPGVSMTSNLLSDGRGNCDGLVTVSRRSLHMTSHGHGGIMPAVRLAAIDVGSNSLHMLVADVSPDGRIQVVDRLKEMVRLGHRAFTSGKLDREAAELA